MIRAKTVLVTGANRGLGLEFIKQFAGLKPAAPEIILATCRNPAEATELNHVAEQNANVKVLKLDVSRMESIEECAVEASNILGDKGLGLLVNNAGINIVTALRQVTMESMIESYKTNTCGPLFMSKSFLPVLKKHAVQEKKANKTPFGSVILNVTGILGSIAKSNGGFYSYRVSKAGGNMVTKTLASELKSYGILTVALHPGWVKTDMGGPKAQLSIEESVTKSMDVIQNLTMAKAGHMLDNDGNEMPF
ncbi:C-signal-like [Tubulanus polymorphus]|uniref:C-signal-like n=1 Tax=Tubulanus polymorphus TaxID=672921 RepID=UPI003DA1D48E